MVTIRVTISYLIDCTLNFLCRFCFCTGVRFGSAGIGVLGQIAYLRQLRVCTLASVRLMNSVSAYSGRLPNS